MKKALNSLGIKGLKDGTRGGDRTRTPLRARDFKSLVSAIPPLGHIHRNNIVDFTKKQAGCSIFYEEEQCYSELVSSSFFQSLMTNALFSIET